MNLIDTLRAIGLNPIVLDDPATMDQQLERAMTDKSGEWIKGDSYEADYASDCESCGQSPTVVVMREGKAIHHVGLCGVCTWGEAAMLDPKKWNE